MPDGTTGEADYDEEREQLIEAIGETLDGVYGQLVDMSSEVDDYLAEYRYDAVQQVIESFSGLVESDDAQQVTELAELRSMADDTLQAPADAPAGVRAEVPRLTAADLPAIAKPTGDDDYGELADSLRDRESRCADHLRKLFDHGEQLWGEATEAAGAGRAEGVDEAMRLLREIPAEMNAAYSLWEQCLVDLYNENPAHLGEMGGMIHGFGTWLAGQRDGR